MLPENLIKNKNISILALDLAQHCGYAYQRQGRATISGVWDLKPTREESKGIVLFKLAKNIREIYNTKGIDVIAYETATVMAGKKGAMRALGVIGHAELQGILKLLTHEWDINYKGYRPTEIKKRAGKGNAKKDEMVRLAEEKFGKEGITHDEADALWLLELAKDEFLKVSTNIRDIF